MIPLHSTGVNLSGELGVSMTAREQQKTAGFAKALEGALVKQDDEELRQACQELESVFVYRLLSTMRDSIPRSDLITRGMATQTFESMLDEEYAKIISHQGSLGLAEIMYRQLSR